MSNLNPEFFMVEEEPPEQTGDGRVHFIILPVDPDEATRILHEKHEELVEPQGDDENDAYPHQLEQEEIEKESKFNEQPGTSDWNKEAVNHLTAQGGFSVHRPSGDEPSEGFMVSNGSNEKVFNKKEEMTPDAVNEYVQQHKDLLDRPDHYFGGWLDSQTGKVYLDVSQHFHDKDEAMNQARQRGEKAIYDIGKGESVYTDQPEQQKVPVMASGGSYGCPSQATTRILDLQPDPDEEESADDFEHPMLGNIHPAMRAMAAHLASQQDEHPKRILTDEELEEAMEHLRNPGAYWDMSDEELTGRPPTSRYDEESSLYEPEEEYDEEENSRHEAAMRTTCTYCSQPISEYDGGWKHMKGGPRQGIAIKCPDGKHVATPSDVAKEAANPPGDFSDHKPGCSRPTSGLLPVDQGNGTYGHWCPECGALLPPGYGHRKPQANIALGVGNGPAGDYNKVLGPLDEGTQGIGTDPEEAKKVDRFKSTDDESIIPGLGNEWDVSMYASVEKIMTGRDHVNRDAMDVLDSSLNEDHLWV